MIDGVPTLALLPLLLFLTGCMTVASSPAPALSCRIEPQAPLVAGGPIRIRFELANRSESPLRVLTWNTPLEGWKGTILEVRRGREELPYQGPMFKRGDPQAGDYAEIPAGGQVDATVDLAEVYDVSRPGTYRIETAGDLLDVTADSAAVPRPRDRHQPAPLRCAPVTLDVAPAPP